MRDVGHIHKDFIDNAGFLVYKPADILSESTDISISCARVTPSYRHFTFTSISRLFFIILKIPFSAIQFYKSDKLLYRKFIDISAT